MVDRVAKGVKMASMELAAQHLVSLVQERRSAALVSNLSTEMYLGQVGTFNVPVSVNHGQSPTCYINCPSRAFLDYGREELDRLTGNPLLRGMGRAALSAFAPLVKATGLDRQVQLNNWLVATNILPPASPTDWLRTFETVQAAFPDHVPVLRSVNTRVHGPLLHALEEAGLTLFPMRKIFLRDYATETDWTTDEQKDARLRDRDDLHQRSGSTFDDADFDAAARLYGALYLEKYSQLNPHYTPAFLRAAHDQLGLQLEGFFTPRGEMVGIIGCFIQHGMLTGPIVGYDTSLPQKLGLYRRLRSVNHGKARAQGLVYNMSAGAEAFKLNRGGAASLEHLVTDFRAMPKGQRRAAKRLSQFLKLATRGLI